MEKPIRVMSLWKIKNTAARRTVIVTTFPLLFLANVVLSAFGFVMFWWRNQRELFRSSAHYWHTDARITDEVPNAALRGGEAVQLESTVMQREVGHGKENV